jgi:hemerythrin superfamily protein
LGPNFADELPAPIRDTHTQEITMARARKKATKSRSVARAARKKGGSTDAITLLKADHRQVEGWFEEFEKARSETRKKELASKICDSLKVHTAIEEEIFYPAFLEATREEDLHHEAEVEHEGAKRLIADIEASGPGEEYYDARVKVLSEMIKHHVKEEEQREGLFARARQSKMDLEALGQQLAARKRELMSGTGETPRGGMLAKLLGRNG